MEPALFQFWHTVYDAGPSVGQRYRITIKNNGKNCAMLSQPSVNDYS